jgi:hypothetical protein
MGTEEEGLGSERWELKRKDWGARDGNFCVNFSETLESF